MDIGWFRDLIICISGVVVTGVVIFVGVISYSFYHRTRAVLDSIEATSRTAQGILAAVRDEVVIPVTQLAAFVQGIRQGVDAISGFFRKQKGGRDG